MKFKELMHVNIVAKDWDKMFHFYKNKLGLELWELVRYKEYLNQPNRPLQQKIAKKDPNRIMYAYFKICPGQFIEMFPKNDDQKTDIPWNKRTGLNHFALVVDDIQTAFKEFKVQNIPLASKQPSAGPSGTWQFWAHDPDGNYFEVMQYTKNSYQLQGHIDN